MKNKLLRTTLTCVVLLSSCFVPERFSAKIIVEPDTSYTFWYSGTVVNPLVAEEIKKGNSLSKEKQILLMGDAGGLLKDPDIKQATYKGDGRYELEIEAKRKPGKPLHMFNLFTVSTGKDGVMTIASSKINANDLRELNKIGIQIDGSLEVKLPKNAEIISHNATSTPMVFGLFGGYSWKIKQPDQRPILKVRYVNSSTKQ